MGRGLIVSVDAMGGDFAPVAELDGLEVGIVRQPGVRYLLCGDEASLKSELEKRPKLSGVCDIRHAPERVSMDAKPAQILRRGQQTSMWQALEAVKTGDADVAISCGNTGVLMAMAKVLLRTMDNIDRPAIAAIWPTIRGESIVLDVGANVDCNDKLLVDFAVMGEAYARAVLGLPKPTVGLLNVGEEEQKGTDSVRRADQFLRSSGLPLDYRGFIEGDDIGKGTVDVVVTDGFSGNVALKTAEGTARQIAHYMSTAIRRSFFGRVGYLFAIGAFNTLRDKMDPRRVNGGVFLGLNGVVVKSHGGTDGTGFASALDLAINVGKSRFSDEISGTAATLATHFQKDRPAG